MKLSIVLILTTILLASCNDSKTTTSSPAPAEEQGVSAAMSAKVSLFAQALPMDIKNQKSDFVTVARAISQNEKLTLSDFVEICEISKGKNHGELGHLAVPCRSLNKPVGGNS